MNSDHLRFMLVIYGIAFTISLIIGCFVGFLLWTERSRPSTIALGAGGAVVGLMTLVVAVVGQLLP